MHVAISKTFLKINQQQIKIFGLRIGGIQIQWQHRAVTSHLNSVWLRNLNQQRKSFTDRFIVTDLLYLLNIQPTFVECIGCRSAPAEHGCLRMFLFDLYSVMQKDFIFAVVKRTTLDCRFI